MTNWGSIMKPYGEYISEAFDISSNLDRYVVSIDIESLNINNERMDFYFSVSNNLTDWTPWKAFYEQSSDFLNGYDVSELYFRYKVIFASEDLVEKPYLQSIKISLDPYVLVENIGDIPMKPKMWIRKIGKGDILIKNQMSGQELIMKDLLNNEEVFIDCENEDIVSSFQNSGIYRYDNHNDEWLEFATGENYIKGYGDFDLDIRYQGKLLQD